jgi:hypothetical protein
VPKTGITDYRIETEKHDYADNGQQTWRKNSSKSTELYSLTI